MFKNKKKAERPQKPKKEPICPDGEFKAYAVLRKPGTGGLWILRTMTIKDGRVVKCEDNVEDMFVIQCARIEDRVSMDNQ
jgi:hypothetical protein